MNKYFSRVLATVALLMGIVGNVHASFLTIDRTITNVTSSGGFPIGIDVFSSETYDLSNGTLVNFSVTGNSAWSAANVGLTWGTDPVHGTLALVLGGLINGLGIPTLGTDDFISYIDPMTGEMSLVAFTLPGIPDIFSSTTIASKFSIADDFGTVPEPGTLALGLMGGLAALAIRRKAKQ